MVPNLCTLPFLLLCYVGVLVGLSSHRSLHLHLAFVGPEPPCDLDLCWQKDDYSYKWRDMLILLLIYG